MFAVSPRNSIDIGCRRRNHVCYHLALVVLIAGAVPGASIGRAETLSPKKAFFMSLLIPGWGQHALEMNGRATTFASIEAVSWLCFAGMTAMRDIYRDDYRAYASSVAGANVAEKDRTYFNDLSFYDTRIQHNQAALTFDQMDQGGPILYGVEDDWQWPTQASRQRFRDRFNDAKKMDQRLEYLVLAISLNHLASAIDAAKSAGRRDASATEHANVSFVPIRGGGGKMVVSFR